LLGIRRYLLQQENIENLTGAENWRSGWMDCWIDGSVHRAARAPRLAFEDFPADAAPVPLVMVIVAGTGQVKKDAAETGLSEFSLHKSLLRFSDGFVVWFVYHLLPSFTAGESR